MKQKSLLWIFKAECLLIAIIGTALYLLKLDYLTFHVSTLIPVSINLLAGILLMGANFNRWLTIVNNGLKLLLICLFPFSLGLALCLLGAPLVIQLAISNWLVMVIGLILFGIMLYPFLKVVLYSLRRIGWQIAGMIILMVTFYLAALNSQLLNFPVSQTNPVLWVSYFGSFGIAIYGMNRWGYGFPRFRINSAVNYWWLGLAVATGLLNLGMSAGSWLRLFTKFQLVLSTHSLVMIAATIIWVGIKEEFMFRYVFLWPMLTVKRQSDQKQIVWAILISSGVFGLFHASNLFIGQGLLPTFLQVFAAFGIGMLFSVITLYTGTIWIGITLHAMIDLIGYPMTSAGVFAGGMSPYMVEFIIITRIIELIVVFLILKNKRAQAAFAQTLAHIRK